MSHKLKRGALTDVGVLGAVKAGLSRALAGPRSVAAKLPIPGAVTGAAVAAAVLGLLMVLIAAPAQHHSPGTSQAAPLAHQAGSRTASASHAAQHRSGGDPGVAPLLSDQQNAGQASPSTLTPSPGSTTLLYPTGRPTPGVSPSPSPSPSPSQSVPPSPSPSPSPSATVPSPTPSSSSSSPVAPLPSPTPSASAPVPTPSPSPSAS